MNGHSPPKEAKSAHLLKYPIHLHLIKPMNGKFHSFTRSIEVIAGLLAVNLCFIIASVFDMEIVGFRWKVTWMTVNLSFLPAIYLISRRNILPAEGLETTLRNSTAYIALHALSFFAMLSLLNYWTHNRSFYFWFYASFVITLPALEFTARRLSKALRKRLGGINSSIIIGTGPTARRLKEELISNSGHGYSFSGFFSNDTAGSDELGNEYKGPVTELENYIKATPVHDIYFTLSGEDYDTLRHVARVADDNLVQLYMVPQMSHYIGRVHELGNWQCPDTKRQSQSTQAHRQQTPETGHRHCRGHISGGDIATDNAPDSISYQTHLQRAGILYPEAHRIPRQRIHLPEIPHHVHRQHRRYPAGIPR